MNYSATLKSIGNDFLQCTNFGILRIIHRMIDAGAGWVEFNKLSGMFDVKIENQFGCEVKSTANVIKLIKIAVNKQCGD